MDYLEINGAHKHNLKNISLKIPKRSFVTITGVSGSGKSTLAYDSIFQEGQRRFLETLSIYARQFIKTLENPELQSLKGIAPTISIDQKHSSFHFNSTVGTISEINPYLRLLFAKASNPRCPGCGQFIKTYTDAELVEHVFNKYKDKSIYIFSLVVNRRKGTYQSLFDHYARRGFLKARVDGNMVYLEESPELKRNLPHTIAIMVDAVKVKEENRKQIQESLGIAVFEGKGEILVGEKGKEEYFSNRLYCQACDISLQEPQPATFSFNSPTGACSQCSGAGCTYCLGSGLNPEARSFYFEGLNMHQMGDMEIRDLLDFFNTILQKEPVNPFFQTLSPQIIKRLETFNRLNMGYISLNRKMNTLSGGELQRARLVSQIGFSLSGIIYVMDEPSIGMHMAEQQNLIRILDQLKQKGNTIIVVEHDETTIKASDYIVDLGPGSGSEGGDVVYAGWFKDFSKAKNSLTSDYIFNRRQISIPKGNKTPTDLLELKNISIHNISKAHLKLPLNALTVVTGVSGSGKSSLILEGLYPALQKTFDGKPNPNLTGASALTRVLKVDQSSIGKTSRSCPATYIQLMPALRQLFAEKSEAKVRGYDQSRFSFNTSGGRCEACKGVGEKKIQMNFLPHLHVICPVCRGQRYHSEVLSIKYNGHSISDVLNLTAQEAFQLFQNIPPLAHKLRYLVNVGLDYITLGQNSSTLSGGESQRIKLTRELGKSSRKPTLYILDEPTVGLHFNDIQKLIDVFHSLISKGHTVVVIEHNPDIIRAADHIIDMGPGGGQEGGQILYQGPLNDLKTISNSQTAQYIFA